MKFVKFQRLFVWLHMWWYLTAHSDRQAKMAKTGKSTYQTRTTGTNKTEMARKATTSPYWKVKMTFVRHTFFFSFSGVNKITYWLWTCCALSTNRVCEIANRASFGLIEWKRFLMFHSRHLSFQSDCCVIKIWLLPQWKL